MRDDVARPVSSTPTNQPCPAAVLSSRIEPSAKVLANSPWPNSPKVTSGRTMVAVAVLLPATEIVTVFQRRTASSITAVTASFSAVSAPAGRLAVTSA